jgi:hypothetical protein
LGAWVGRWGGALKHILIVESVQPDGSASWLSGTAAEGGTTLASSGDRHVVDQPVGKCRAWDNVNDHGQDNEPLRNRCIIALLGCSKGR